MKFSYSSSILSTDSGDFLVIYRPEIPVTIVGPSGRATYVALVDTGSDYTIFPKSVADCLAIPVHESTGPLPSVFGGHRVRLLVGDVLLKLELGGETLSWRTVVCFYEFASPDDEAVVLGHSGFLDYFTATFDGKLATLELTPNDELPAGKL